MSALAIALGASSTLALMASSAHAYDGSGSDYYAYDGGAGYLAPGADGPIGGLSGPGPVSGPSGSVALSFQGISQYDVAALGRNFIPPDTNGAIGATQFMETTNGAYAVYDKTTGARTSIVSDVAFWAAAGQVGANGDSWVMYDKRSGRWIAESFGASISDIQIAVSTTSDALGPWKSTKFTGFPGIADYPTLAMDSKAVYIGTNDFNAAGTAFKGTTLNVIARNDLFGPGAPVTSSLKQFYTPCCATITDNGYAIQGVNQVSGDSGKVIAVALNNFGDVRYNITNPGTAGATQTATQFIDTTPYDSNGKGRQPYTTGTGDPRQIDTSDDRISSAAWEQAGKIYSVHTITPTGTDHTEVQWQVIDATTGAIIQTGTIGGNGDGYDYYQGAITVNKSGQVVIGYDRSGNTTGVGKISFYAAAFSPTVANSGVLNLKGTYLLKVSDTDSYHNGSTAGNAAAGRQRWGDYSQVTVDPTNDESFWAIGEYAREFNNPASGHPGGTGGSRWGTWISNITLASVPEPGTWAMMLAGFGLVGGALRRRARSAAVTA